MGLPTNIKFILTFFSYYSAVNFSEEPLHSESARTDISEDDQMTNLLIEKAWTFVKSRSLRWQMIEGAELVIAGKPDANGELNIGKIYII